MSDFYKSFAIGYACLAAWADLLDRINVFPVADGDTGTNLRISLAPLREYKEWNEITPKLLTRCATGNSGNIAAAFFREFCTARGVHELAEKTTLGREQAWEAIANPCPGTMLTVFDSLAEGLASYGDLTALYEVLSVELQAAVRSTTELLPDLKEAGVVDSGALAMYIFFDGFFRHLTQQRGNSPSIFTLFENRLAINNSFKPEITDGYCVDLLLQAEENEETIREQIAELGESVVVVRDESLLKVHIHTAEPSQLRGQLDRYGDIVQWSDEKIEQESVENATLSGKKMTFHIITDAAGSMTREMAQQHGVTLLESYIITGDSSRPETLYEPDQIYPLMRKGRKVTTAQASTFERHQHYRSLCQQFGRCLYLCVGSAFTGNYDIAMAWKKENDPENLMTVIDTGAASGRLALIALLTALETKTNSDPESIIAFVRRGIDECDEYVFIDELKYLVAGGRVSKAGGFFGDLLHMKPIICPTSKGVQKAGVVRSRKGQLNFAMEKLSEKFMEGDTPLILLQYSDNEEWVTETVSEQVKALLPRAEIVFTPLSLTSGVHMGPGTWSMAFMPSHHNVNRKISKAT